MYEDKHLFDMSDYPKDFKTLSGQILHNTTNKKVIGKMKDETAGIIIKEVVALKSKAYAVKSINSLDSTDEHLIKKLKGVQKATIKKNVTFDMYKDCLFNQKTFNTEFNIFQSKNHRIYTEKITKISLTPNDTKRQILPDLISTLPFDYKQITS